MRVFDQVAYDAVAVTDYRYQLTLKPGFNGFPSDVDDCAAVIRDGSGNAVYCTGYVTTTGQPADGLFIIQEVFDTSDGETMPNFSGDPVLFSSEFEGVQRRKECVAGVVGAGQSNCAVYGQEPGVGEDGVPSYDFDDPRIQQWVADGNVVAKAGAHLAPAIGRHYHSDYPYNSAQGVSWFNPYARTLLEKGFNQVCLIPAAHGATGFLTGVHRWEVDGTYYTKTLNHIIDFLNASPYHFLHVIVFMIGETDAGANITKAAYQAAAKATVEGWKSAVLAATGRSIARVPVVFCGMNQVRLDTNDASDAVIESANMDMGLELDYSAGYPLPFSTSYDGVHHDAATNHLLGAGLEVYRRIATANYPESGYLELAGTAPTADVSGNTASLETTAPDPLNLDAVSALIATVSAGAATLETTQSHFSDPGPIVLNDTEQNYDSDPGTLPQEHFDALILPFKVMLDTEWQQSWCYFPNDHNETGALLRLRMQPGAGNLNFQMYERAIGGAFSEVFTGSIPYTLLSVISLMIIRDGDSGLVELWSGNTFIGSGIPSDPLVVVEAIIHFGNTTAGAESVFTDVSVSTFSKLSLEAATPTADSSTPAASLETTEVSPYPNAGNGTLFLAKGVDVTHASAPVVSTWANQLGNETANVISSSGNITQVGSGGIEFAVPFDTNAPERMALPNILAGIAAAGSGTFIIDYAATAGYLVTGTGCDINLSTGDVSVLVGTGAKFNGNTYNFNDGVRNTIRVTADATVLRVYRGTTLVHTINTPTLVDPASPTLAGSAFGSLFTGTVYNVYGEVGGGLKTLTQLNAIVSDFPA